MINWNKSAKLNNCTVEWLKARFGRFPSSNKKIVTNCNNCNEERVLNFFDYRGDDCDLCHSCSTQTPEARKSARLRSIERYSDHAERDIFSARITAYWADQTNRDAQSRRRIEYFKDPKNREMARLKTIEQFSTQEARDAHSRIMEEHTDSMKGGNDIIRHHYLYDDSDLSKYTMSMTRSEHGKMHRRMQLAGYEVPHINSDTDDNGLWGYA